MVLPISLSIVHFAMLSLLLKRISEQFPHVGFALDDAFKKRYSVEQTVRRQALRGVREEQYNKGLEALKRSPVELQKDLAKAHTWPDVFEVTAAAFSLNRPNLGKQRKLMVSIFPEQWRKSLVKFKALHLACEIEECFTM